VTWLKGLAKFTAKDRLDVAGTEYRAKNFVIATGSSVTPLPGVEIDQKRIVDSTRRRSSCRRFPSIWS
jgi:dihydrolipoamide dehydrogenase